MLSTTERQAAAWVGGLFLIAVLLQRFSVPGLTTVALLVPVLIVWVAAALARGVVVLDSTRFFWWLAVAVVTAILMLIQYRVVAVSVISVKSWALLLVTLLPFVVRLAERSLPAYLAALRHIATISTAIAIANIGMIGMQFAGVAYTDWFALIVPKSMQLEGFNYSYPIQWGSPIYKANAFVGLEPSIVSALLGVGILAAILTRARWWKLTVLAAGIVATMAGSGMVVVIIGIAVMLISSGSQRLVYRFIPLLAVGIIIGWFSDFGRLLFGRIGEFQSDDSSTALRAVEPYRVLFPEWIQHLSGVLLGYGPGSADRIAEATFIDGLLVTTPAKIFFEYGLIGGAVLGGFVLICYWGGPSRALSVSLLISIWLLQQGLLAAIITLPVLVTVTLWSPRTGAPLESARSRADPATQPNRSDVELSTAGSLPRVSDGGR